MQEPLERLCLMARLTEGAAVLSGGALASRLHGHGRHGDAALVGAFIRRIMDHVCVPLYNILTRWIQYGELQDPYEEFFVGYTSHPKQQQHLSYNMWQDTYLLRPAMLPSFLPPALANKVLVIGKTINFIRICQSKLPNINLTHKSSKPHAKGRKSVGTSSNRNNMKDLLDHSNNAEDEEIKDTDMNMDMGVDGLLKGLRYGGEAVLSEVVHRIARTTDSRLLNLMQHRFYLSLHLLALKKFLLLGQGDFVTCLMDMVGPELKKRANQLYRHNLTGMLEGALRSSNSQFEPAFIIDRVGVRLLEASPGDSGWEVFSLDYAIDIPLNAVVDSESISRYRTAFHMLWRLKRVEWTLAASWKQMTSFAKDSKLPKLRPIIHKCTLSRGKMMHVVSNLCAFIMFEVLETAWATFHDKISQANCLDDVIFAHNKYLDEILDRALLSAQHENLNLQIQQLLQSILKFCTLEDALLADMGVVLARKRAQSLAVLESEKRGGSWTSSTHESDDTPGNIDGIPVYVIARIEEAAEEYNKQFDTIMNLLRDQGEQANDFVKHLTFRLDFNEYHISNSKK